MKYILQKSVLENTPEINISEQEYIRLRNARNSLSNALAIEEKYEIVVSNYLEFEQEVMNASLRYMVREHLDYSDFFNLRLNLNIRLVNLLTAIRLYVDQLNQNVSECLADTSSAKDNVKKLFSSEYEGNLFYRFMEALRNYVQHRGMPVHLIQQSGHFIPRENDGLVEYSINLSSQRSFLQEDSKMKKSVLDEIDEKVDLKVATRIYVESISRVHVSIRSMIADTVSQSRKLIEDAHIKYSKVHNGSLLGLSTIKCIDNVQLESIPLLLNWDDVRENLQKRNIQLINLSKRYASGVAQTT